MSEVATITAPATTAETTTGRTKIPLVDRLAPLFVAGATPAPALPQHRQLEMYSRPLLLSFAEAETSELPLTDIAGALRAFAALAAAIGPRDAEYEGGTSWQRYKALPRRTGTEKLVAELFRALRLIWVCVADRSGHVEWNNGLVGFDRLAEASTVTMKISPAGLTLLHSAVAYFLEVRRLPYPDSYVEAMLSEYYADVVAEIRSFCDENKSLYQFRRKLPLNRYVRLDCDNPKARIDGDDLLIEIGEAYRDPARFPIDFYLIHDGVLHIVPVEALVDGRLPLAQLADWRTALPEGGKLPALFRSRFSRGRRS
ncbi:MAG: hypothetical protein HZA66_24770 [Rhodopseudomonas palustris]|uniref:Uncharacterized protein n=1 Tax=Rhodopseudomonas palustris TaxID=1076 RepID=A0A933W3X8_RHOPL|nr:hypothetical protein [Rhodopseudomonas palustris]